VFTVILVDIIKSFLWKLFDDCTSIEIRPYHIYCNLLVPQTGLDGGWGKTSPSHSLYGRMYVHCLGLDFYCHW
jgi:hypothetical protein